MRHAPRARLSRGRLVRSRAPRREFATRGVLTRIFPLARRTRLTAAVVAMLPVAAILVACGPRTPADAASSQAKTTATDGPSSARASGDAGAASAGGAGHPQPPTREPAGSDGSPAPGAPARLVDLETKIPGNDERCQALVGHQLELLRTTGPEALRERSAPMDVLVEGCKGRSLVKSQLECRLQATSWAGLEQCARDALAGEAEARPGRTFTASTMDGVSPPALSVDRDYVAHGEACGLYVRDVYPSGALFIACDGAIVAGPMVSQAEIDVAIAVVRGDPKDAPAVRAAVEAAWASLGGTPPLR